MSNFDLSVMLFLQIFIILITCRAIGWLAGKIGQPQVMGEMIAGIILGPSLFGLVAPDLQQQLFPQQSRTIIYAISQLGLILYMFTIGVEFDLGLIRQRWRSAASVSAAGILVPFGLGCIIAWFLVGNSIFFSSNTPGWIGMLFLGAAMSITAFPMLARLIRDKGLTGTPLGTLALAAGSIDDAVAWGALAIVLACFKADLSIALLAIVGGGLFVVFNLTIVRTLLKPLGQMVERQGSLNGPVFSFILALLMLAAWTTDRLGIYAVFGAFILGTAIPRGLCSRELLKKIEPLAAIFLLPLFFVNSGLNTRLGLLDQPYLWLVALVVLVAAITGKGVACWLAARAHGEPQHIALAIGSLMNARGLMELIALNIGLEQGIITPVLFSIMVIMTIVTNLMTSPLFELFYRRGESIEKGAVQIAGASPAEESKVA